MLSETDAIFLRYWTENREKQKTSLRPFFIGLSAGILLGISILVSLMSGWFERADMVANSKMSSIVFILAILIVSFSMAYLYRKFRWEMQEQRFLELQAAKKRGEKKDPVQP